MLHIVFSSIILLSQHKLKITRICPYYSFDLTSISFPMKKPCSMLYPVLLKLLQLWTNANCTHRYQILNDRMVFTMTPFCPIQGSSVFTISTFIDIATMLDQQFNNIMVTPPSTLVYRLPPINIFLMKLLRSLLSNFFQSDNISTCCCLMCLR